MTGTADTARARLDELLARVGTDLAHPAAPELLRALRSGACRSELQALLERASVALEQLAPGPLLALCETAAELGLVEEALALAERTPCASEPRVALRRGGWAMLLGRPELALQAADSALLGLLQPGLGVEEFLALVVRGAPAEGLLRYSRTAVAQRAELSEPIALRWEAARKLGRTREANLMRLFCLRFFPERASVWATAGNQALDEGEPNAAASYFRQCLRLEPDWTAGLAGMAIVLERQKDWQAALPYRKRVVEVEQALAHTEPASLQRVLRYSAALARVERWHEAGPLFRRCAALGAYQSVPAERPVLLRVFSRELYAPALIAHFCVFEAPLDPSPEIALAMHEAGLLAQLEAARDVKAAELLCGMCAWLAGDMPRAHALLDAAELPAGDDCALHYLLLDTAEALAHPERDSIARYAAENAKRTVLAPEADEEQALYAHLILTRLREPTPDPHTVLRDGPMRLRELYYEAPDAPLGPGANTVRRLTAYRSLRQRQGMSPLSAAALSTTTLLEIAAAGA